ncbi:MAG: restriction endonuclease subunit S [Bacteroidia bacterium]
MESKNQGYKHTELGWLPEGWEVRELGELVDKQRPISYGIVQTGDPVSKGIKCVRVTDIDEGKICENDLITTSKEISNRYRRTILKKGDVVLALRGKIGSSAIVGDSMAGANLTRGVALISQSDNLSSKFVHQWLSSPIGSKELESRLNGSALKEISIGVLRMLPFPLPPLSEQRAIADLLGCWDRAIGAMGELIRQKQARKKWLMQVLLNGKRRLPGFAGEWKRVKLGEVFQEVRTQNDGNANATMTISARHGLITQGEKFDRIIAGNSLPSYTLIEKGDFAYNKGNSKLYQMGCIYLLEEAPSALVPFVYICFRPRKGKASANFYKHWFINHGLDRQLKKIITSGARGDGLLNVARDDFFALRLPVPSLEEQEAIGKVLQACGSECLLLETKLAMLQLQKKGLMQILLSGRIRLV